MTYVVLRSPSNVRDSTTRAQTIVKLCISHHADSAWIDMNLNILPAVMDKYLTRLNSFTLAWQPIEKKEYFEFKSVKHR